MRLPPDHPLRVELNDEAHARLPDDLVPPSRLSYLALAGGAATREQGWLAVQALARGKDVAPPAAAASHFSADFGAFRLRAERHTEYVGCTFIVAGAVDDPFDAPAIAAAPADWVAALPGQVVVAANVAFIRGGDTRPDIDRIAGSLFAGNALVGATIGGRAGIALTDFRIHPDGWSRLYVQDRVLTRRQAGRMVQRLLEIDTYRILALLAFPLARQLAPTLVQGERELAEITAALANAHAADEPVLLERLTRLQAGIESRQADNQYRFDAADAYHALVRRRIAELREERIPGLQTFQEFTERRLEPAMNTVRMAAARQESLSQRAARTTQLLSTRVDIAREEQTQRVLASMNRRAKLQLRLQETVEGLSVAAVTYYIVGLIGYAAKGLKSAGLRLEPELVIAISIPLVVLLTALGVRRIRRLVAREA